MSALTFTLKVNSKQILDCQKLTPNLLKNKSLTEIESITLGSNTVAEVFDVSGNDASQVVFKNANQQLHFIGHRMKNGTITIKGDAGDYLGSAMQGGILICQGSAGERTADQMRRGILLIEGSVGEYCAANMKAGTVGILGKAAGRLGYGMKRGTLLLGQAPTEQATWLNCGLHTLPFLSILYQSLQQLDTKFASINQKRVQRWVGDISSIGKAEMLLLQK